MRVRAIGVVGSPKKGVLCGSLLHNFHRCEYRGLNGKKKVAPTGSFKSACRIRPQELLSVRFSQDFPAIGESVRISQKCSHITWLVPSGWALLQTRFQLEWDCFWCVSCPAYGAFLPYQGEAEGRPFQSTRVSKTVILLDARWTRLPGTGRVSLATRARCSFLLSLAGRPGLSGTNSSFCGMNRPFSPSLTQFPVVLFLVRQTSQR
jgi:hypothetical protein